MNILEKTYIVEMPNGEKWGVPVEVIARNRAAYYAERDYDGDIEKSLADDTVPMFEGDDYEIEDWAKSNMNWVDVMGSAKLITIATTDYQEGWMNGEVEVA